MCQKYPRTAAYDRAWLQSLMMGPNAAMLLEEMAMDGLLRLTPGERVLDLGCGMGLTSIFLAKEFDVQVYAADLWVTATNNWQRFQSLGLGDRMVPIHADVENLPFADGFFDTLVCIDAYNYFGRDEKIMDAKIAPLVRPGGTIVLAFPGFHEEIHAHLPPELLLSWKPEDLDTMHSIPWWRELLSASERIQLEHLGEMACFDEAWSDWLACENPYAQNDRASMNAGAGRYMNLIAVVARVL